MQSPSELYLVEAQDLLAQIEETALTLATGVDDAEAVNRLFRAFHTIKGSGAMFGFAAVAGFTHHLESALDVVRTGECAFTRDWIDVILQAKDHIRALLDSPAPAELAPQGEVLLRRLTTLLGAAAAVAHAGAGEAAVQPQARAASPVAERRAFTIDLRPPLRVAHSGMDPATLLRDLRALGECVCEAHLEALPALEELDAEACYLRWTVRLVTEAELNAVKDVFIFLDDETCFSVTPLETETVPTAAAAQPAVTGPGDPATSGALATRSTGATDAVVRVAAERLDRLVSLVGELVMNQSRLNRCSQRIQDSDLAAPVEAFERLIGELRDHVLSIRMTPIGSAFGRLRRLVHDLSRELGKDVSLVTHGEETELDKTVLDRVVDPLVHLIRNSLDHGIEPRDERVAAGKPPHGTVRLDAIHQGTEVLIRIEDDGRGLDPQRLRARAVERGLILPEAVLSERELLDLIFLPGFSTAKTVTAVSGRGVGMDVVKRQVEALRGSVRLESVVGKGTTITLALPMTLAIIEGLLVELNGDPYIIPLSAVLENVELPREVVGRQHCRHVIPVRGELVPFIRLRQVLGLTTEGRDYEKVVVVRHDGHRVGLVVDRVLGTHQTVIQPLSRFCRALGVLAGTTIMGDGRVALILDIAGVLRRDADAERRTTAA